MSWITLKITSTHWEAELMQQMLDAHDIPARVVSQGVPHFGCGSAACLQVLAKDQWTARLLLSPIDEEASFDRDE